MSVIEQRSHWQKTQKDSLHTLASHMLDLAKQEGADHATISGSTSITDKVVIESYDLNLAYTTEETILSLSLICNQKQASATVNTTDPQRLRETIRKTLQIAKHSARDDDLVIAPKSDNVTILPFINQDSLLKLSLQDLLEASMTSLSYWNHQYFSPDRLETSLDTSVHVMMNSNGLVRDELSTITDWGFAGFCRDDEHVSSVDYDGGFSHTSFQPLTEHAKSFQSHVLKGLNPQTLTRTPRLVLITPRAMDDFLLDPILYHLNGSILRDKKSKWPTQGEKVLPSSIHITENPHQRDFRDATSWDHDGLATYPQILINHGCVSQHIHNCHTAKSLQTTPSGLAGGPFGLKMHGGQDSLDNLMHTEYVLVIERFSGHIDPLTGDFSGVAKNSYTIDKQIQTPITETMVSGNLFKALENIQGLSQETINISGSYESPYVLMSSIQIS